MDKKVLIVGAGLAGSEAAFYLAEKGIKVVLAEVKKIKKGPHQKVSTASELVCTNSLKSLAPSTPHGILKTEMRALDSLILKVAIKHSVPAGQALAVDRENFSAEIDNILRSHENIQFIDEEVINPLEAKAKYSTEAVILATGPLVTEGLTDWIVKELTGNDDFYFYDAIAPVVDADSLNYEKLYIRDRHGEFGVGDYLNAPLTKEEYALLIDELKSAEKVKPKSFEEEKFFESCLPVDLMAERGPETARFSCMRPIGLELENGKRPYAVVQLRKENLPGDAYNLVGFQTRLTYPEQKRVFSKIPGLEEASFLHLGSVHRNSFLNAKRLLNRDLSTIKYPSLYFAGQITGVEGYTESASMGLYAAFQVARKLAGGDFISFPNETAIGALVNYIMTAENPVPSNINMGLLPKVDYQKKRGEKRGDIKKAKKELAAERAKMAMDDFLKRLDENC